MLILAIILFTEYVFSIMIGCLIVGFIGSIFFKEDKIDKMMENYSNLYKKGLKSTT